VQLPLAQRAHRIWGELPALIGTDGEYQRSGHFKIARSEADLAALERYRAMSRDFDLGLQMVSAASLRERCPWLGVKRRGRLAVRGRRPGQPAPGVAGLRAGRAARRARRSSSASPLDRGGSTTARCSWCVPRC
jgi:sarcosine oxidase subunit beta